MLDPEKKTDDPVKLGITGGVGSGKSAVCSILKNKGLTVVSTDEMAKKAVEPGMPAYKKIVDFFGTDVLEADGTLNRKKIRGIITKDIQKKKKLEEFVHPEVFVQMGNAYEASKAKNDMAIAVEVPLLFETGMESLFDFILTVSVDSEKRISRLMVRDNISKKEAEALIGIQMPEAEKLEKSDFVIDNNGSLEDTQELVEQFYGSFLKQIEAISKSV